MSTITIQLTKEFEESLWALGLVKEHKEEMIRIKKDTLKREKQVQYLQWAANCPEWCYVECDVEMMDELCEIEANVYYVKEYKLHKLEAEVRLIYGSIGVKHYTTFNDFCQVYGFDEHFCCCIYKNGFYCKCKCNNIL
mgnify:CR=1 FL=1